MRKFEKANEQLRIGGYLLSQNYCFADSQNKLWPMVSILTSTLPVLLDEILFTDPLLLLMLGSRGVPGGVTIWTMVLNMGATPIRRFFLISLNLSVNCEIKKLKTSLTFKLYTY